MKKIIVPVDGSPASEKATAKAIELAKEQHLKMPGTVNYLILH